MNKLKIMEELELTIDEKKKQVFDVLRIIENNVFDGKSNALKSYFDKRESELIELLKKLQRLGLIEGLEEQNYDTLKDDVKNKLPNYYRTMEWDLSGLKLTSKGDILLEALSQL